MEPLSLGALLLKHWRLLALFLLLLGAMGWGGYLAYRWGEAKVIEAEAAQKAAEEARDAAQEANRQAEESAQAAQEARNRNDEILSAIRSAVRGRVDRAPTADAAQRVRDVQAAQDELAAAASAVRAADAR